jgi:2-iminoacetate synthase ThiH
MPSKIAGCTNVILYYGSSTYNQEQMTQLIDNIVQDYKAVGIETLTPVELARLTEAR